MPNPLMLATTTPNTTAKHFTSQRDQSDSKPSTGFQEILNQESPADVAGVEIAGPSETELEVETEVAEVEVADASAPGPALDGLPVEILKPTGGAPPSLPAPDNPVRTRPVDGTPVNLEDRPLSEPSSMPASHSPAKGDDVTPTRLQDRFLAQPPVRDTHNHAHTTQIRAGNLPRHTSLQQPLTGEVAESPKARSAIPEAARPDSPRTSVPPRAPRHMPTAPDHRTTFAQLHVMAAVKPNETKEAATALETDGLHASRSEPMHQHLRETAPQPTVATTAARAEVSRAIAGQMAAAVYTRAGSGTVEIALNPEELGRVSIVFNGRDDGLHMAITAERPETLDLMRRHIAVLTAEFQKMGYDDLSFDLGANPNPQRDSPEAQADRHLASAPGESDDQNSSIPQRTAPGKGIDMRL